MSTTPDISLSPGFGQSLEGSLGVSFAEIAKDYVRMHGVSNLKCPLIQKNQIVCTFGIYWGPPLFGCFHIGCVGSGFMDLGVWAF